MYRIIFTREAQKALQKAPRYIVDEILEKIKVVALDPFASHPNITKLQGRTGFRLRVGEWRVIYDLEKDQLIILVLKIAPRGEVYR